MDPLGAFGCEKILGLYLLGRGDPLTGGAPPVLNFLCKYPPRSEFYHVELLGEPSPMHDEIVLDRWREPCTTPPLR